MNILAIDTSTANLTLALFSEGKIIAKRNKKSQGILSESIIPIIDGALKKAVLSLSDIDCFAVGLGPGSFTGLRVGLATIKGFATALKIPIIGVSSLDIIASNVRKDNVQICIVLDARRGNVFAAIYNKENGVLKRSGEYFLAPIDELLKRIKKQAVFCGDGVSIYKDKIINSGKALLIEEEKNWFPKAENLIMLALKKAALKEFANNDTLKPLYLYPDDCQVQK
ncbi:MAG: tRNA (adenosine(37)-N6)-threonylcarbamoyltransferase complex dimerization subunit type 1 TsaB [Candidatus Omnitrophica bacterium]|nr:tRNA (adenosine(37)-N6)-threonylcarbamoyltransferase complex dimerization subunit type 1 TsaB [Candidatus Omnitrophota bacterium]